MGFNDTPLIATQTGADLYRAAPEHEALGGITYQPQTSASFAKSALVNVGLCTLDEIKALIAEVARIARDVGEAGDIDDSTMEPVLEALDSAHDLIDEVHVIGEDICPTCSGSGEGRSEGSRCHACHGKGVV